jgi:hypothetical protein
MTKDFECLHPYINNLSKQPKGIFTLSLKTVGDELLLIIPNVENSRFCQDSFRRLAIEENLPKSVASLTTLMVNNSIDCPERFLKSALTALVLENCYGSITIEYPDARAFIGTITLSYRGLRLRQ